MLPRRWLRYYLYLSLISLRFINAFSQICGGMLWGARLTGKHRGTLSTTRQASAAHRLTRRVWVRPFPIRADGHAQLLAGAVITQKTEKPPPLTVGVGGSEQDRPPVAFHFSTSLVESNCSRDLTSGRLSLLLCKVGDIPVSQGHCRNVESNC